MALLVTRVLWDEVEVLAADDDGTVHLGGDDGAGEDTAADGDQSGEGALLVCSRLVSIYDSCLDPCPSPPCPCPMNQTSHLTLKTRSREQEQHIPMYEPSIATFGVLKPRPTSLYHLLPPFPTLFDLPLWALELRKMCGCFWKARSLWTVNSVAMVAECGRSSVVRWAASLGCCRFLLQRARVVNSSKSKSERRAFSKSHTELGMGCNGLALMPEASQLPLPSRIHHR